MWILLTIRSFLCLIMIVQEMLPLWSLIAIARDEHFLVNIMTEDDVYGEEEDFLKISHSTIPSVIAIYLDCWISFTLHIVKNDSFNVECMLHLCRRWMCRCNKSWQLHPVVNILFIYFPHNSKEKLADEEEWKKNEWRKLASTSGSWWLVGVASSLLHCHQACLLAVENAPETHFEWHVRCHKYKNW